MTDILVAGRKFLPPEGNTESEKQVTGIIQEAQCIIIINTL